MTNRLYGLAFAITFTVFVLRCHDGIDTTRLVSHLISTGIGFAVLSVVAHLGARSPLGRARHYKRLGFVHLRMQERDRDIDKPPATVEHAAIAAVVTAGGYEVHADSRELLIYARDRDREIARIASAQRSPWRPEDLDVFASDPAIAAAILADLEKLYGPLRSWEAVAS